MRNESEYVYRQPEPDEDDTMGPVLTFLLNVGLGILFALVVTLFEQASGKRKRSSPYLED